MSDDSNSCIGCGTRVLIWIVVLSLIFVWYERNDGKDFIDSSIEQVHHWYSHADSVWTQNDTIR